MTTTMQVLMSVFTVAGFILAKVHTILSSPVGQDVMKVLAQAADQHQTVQAHNKLQALHGHVGGLFKEIAIVKHAADTGAQKAGGQTVDIELQAVIDQAKALYMAQKSGK